MLFWNFRLLAGSNLEADLQKNTNFMQIPQYLYLCTGIIFTNPENRRFSVAILKFWKRMTIRVSMSLYFHLFLFIFCSSVAYKVIKKRGKFNPPEYFLRIQSFFYCLSSNDSLSNAYTKSRNSEILTTF